MACMANDTAEQQTSSRTDTLAVLLAHPALNRELPLTCKLLCVSKFTKRTLAAHCTGVHVHIRAHPAAQEYYQLQLVRKLQQFSRWLRGNGALLRALNWESPGPCYAAHPSVMELGDILAGGVVGAAVRQRQQQLQPLRLAAYSGLHNLDEATCVLRSLPQLTSLALQIRPHPCGLPQPELLQTLITTLASSQVLKSLELQDARGEGGFHVDWARRFKGARPLPLDHLLRAVQPLPQLTRLKIGHLGDPSLTVDHLSDPGLLAYLPSQLAELSYGLCTEVAINLSHVTGLKILRLPAVCLSGDSVLPQGLLESCFGQVYSCRPLLGLKHLRKLHVNDVTDRTPEDELLRITYLTGRCDVALHYKHVAVFMQHAAAGMLQFLSVKGLAFDFVSAEILVAPVFEIVSQLTGLTKLAIHEICFQQCNTSPSSMRAVLKNLSKLRALGFSAGDCRDHDLVRSVVFQALPTLTNLEELSCTYSKLRPCTKPAEIDAGAEIVMLRPDEQLQCLLQATGLTSLSLAESDMTHVELASLAASLTALKALDIRHMAHLNDDSLHAIAAFTGLTRLGMFNCGVSDEGAQQMTVLQHLKEFCCTCCTRRE